MQFNINLGDLFRLIAICGLAIVTLISENQTTDTICVIALIFIIITWPKEKEDE